MKNEKKNSDLNNVKKQQKRSYKKRKSKIEKPKSKEILALANRIKNLRIAKGYSNYEFFAFEHQISRAQYGRYERGEDMRFSSLIKIVKAFDMTLEDFFSEGFEDILKDLDNS